MLPARVPSLPLCDLCAAQASGLARAGIFTGFVPQTALYDGRTQTGPWAYMCQAHFDSHGIGLGLGRGQILMAKTPDEPRYVGGDD